MALLDYHWYSIVSPKETHPIRYSARDVSWGTDPGKWGGSTAFLTCFFSAKSLRDADSQHRSSSLILQRWWKNPEKWACIWDALEKELIRVFCCFFQQQVDCFAGCFGMTGESAIRLCESMKLSLKKHSKVFKAMQAETNQQNQHCIVEFESTSCIQKVPWWIFTIHLHACILWCFLVYTYWFSFPMLLQRLSKQFIKLLRPVWGSKSQK